MLKRLLELIRDITLDVVKSESLMAKEILERIKKEEKAMLNYNFEI